MRVVLDTDVVVAGFRSPRGASAALIVEALEGRMTLLMSVALALEYEALCTDPTHVSAAGLTPDEAQIFVDGLLATAEPVTPHFLWRPQLRDPADEMVLETAINGVAHALVTFNARDFGDAPGRFGIELLQPVDALRRVQG